LACARPCIFEALSDSDRKFIEFTKLMTIYLNHFPAYEKYGLALEIRRAAYEVYALIVECQKRYHKKTTLTSLDIRHEQLRMMIRLANELGHARKTHTLNFLLTRLRETYADYLQLPKIYRSNYQPHFALT
jgi:hypothetical protein